MKLISLDSGPLGKLTHPNKSEESEAYRGWLTAQIESGISIVLPSIVDYEIRRDYLRRGQINALRLLDKLATRIEFLSLSDEDLREAANLWAEARRAGKPTADNKALDVDCILVVQIRAEAIRRNLKADEWIIATADTGDISRLAPAAVWNEI